MIEDNKDRKRRLRNQSKMKESLIDLINELNDEEKDKEIFPILKKIFLEVNNELKVLAEGESKKMIKKIKQKIQIKI